MFSKVPTRGGTIRCEGNEIDNKNRGKRKKKSSKIMCWRMSFIKLLDEIRKMLNITIALADCCCEEIEIRRCLTQREKVRNARKINGK